MSSMVINITLISVHSALQSFKSYCLSYLQAAFLSWNLHTHSPLQNNQRFIKAHLIHWHTYFLSLGISHFMPQVYLLYGTRTTEERSRSLISLDKICGKERMKGLKKSQLISEIGKLQQIDVSSLYGIWIKILDSEYTIKILWNPLHFLLHFLKLHSHKMIFPSILWWIDPGWMLGAHGATLSPHSADGQGNLTKGS